jgi:hypothetical protein
MIKTLFLTAALAILVCSAAWAQLFEGKIIYHNVYKSKKVELSDFAHQKYFGSGQDYYIKGGNYSR